MTLLTFRPSLVRFISVTSVSSVVSFRTSCFIRVASCLVVVVVVVWLAATVVVVSEATSRELFQIALHLRRLETIGVICHLVVVIAKL